MDETKEQLKELIESLKTSDFDQEYIDWMKETAHPDAGLIDALVMCFMESIDDIEFANDILKSLQ